MGQVDIFGEEHYDAISEAPELPGQLSTRRPGWYLITTRRGPTGLWYTVKVVGKYGEVVTGCGITGRKVEESQRQVLLCRDCLEA